MIRVLIFVVVLVYATCFPAFADYGTEEKAIAENNAGVTALNRSNMVEAISHFEKSLDIDPSYAMAKTNLAIALNNTALAFADIDLKLALSLFCKSYYLCPSNTVTTKNISVIIASQGRDANKFDDRVAIADTAAESGDPITACVNYKAALDIRSDESVKAKLDKVSKLIGKEGSVIPLIEKAFATNMNKAADLFEQKKYAEAETLYYTISRFAGSKPELCFSYGAVLQARGKKQEALDQYKKAFDLEPSNGEYEQAYRTMLSAIERETALQKSKTQVHRKKTPKAKGKSARR